MYYAKRIDENGDVVGLQSMSVPFPEVENLTSISEEEYTILFAEFEKSLGKSNDAVIEQKYIS